MNVKDVIAAVQSQPRTGSAKAGGSEKAGLFQSLLTEGLQKAGEQPPADQLLDLLSQLSSDQIAQLMAMFGMNPQISQSVESVTAAGAGRLSVNLPTGTQSMFLAKGMQPAVDSLVADLFAAAGQAQSTNDGTAKPAGLPTAQFAQNLSELLKQAGISAEAAVSQLKDMFKNGDNLVAAFGQLAENVKHHTQPHQMSGVKTAAEGTVAVLADTASLRQTGSQIRPDMLTPASDAGKPQSGLSTNADGPSGTPVNQPAAAVSEQTVFAQNLTASGLPLGRNAHAIEGQPTTAQVKMSSAQFESDFPTMVVKQATLTERGGLSEMRVTLMPEGMGEIHVRIQGEGGIVSLQIAADSQHARSLLDANLGILKQHLEAQGMQLNRVEVVAANTSAGMNTMDQGMFDGRRQQQDTNQQQSNRQPSASTNYQFEEELIYQQTSNMSEGQYDWTA